jgi:hypothetical protein
MAGATNYGLNALYTAPTIDSAGNAVLDKRLAIAGSVVSVSSNNFTIQTTGGAVNTINAAGAANATVSTVDFDVQTANVMATWDGSTPSATNGHVLSAGNSYSVSYRQWIAMKFIQQTAPGVIQASAMSV